MKGEPITLADALELKEGDRVCTPHSRPARKPYRITQVWVNDKRTIVMIRCHSLAGHAWLDATGYEHPPEGMVWDMDRWMTPEQWDQHYGARGSGMKRPPIFRPARAAHGP